MTDDDILDAEVRAAARVKKIIGGGARELTIETVRESLASGQSQSDALSALLDAFIERDGFGFTYSRIWKALHDPLPDTVAVDPGFPPMPPSVVTHPKLGPMWDRLEMQFYAIKFFEKYLAEKYPAADRRVDASETPLTCAMCGGCGATVGCDACTSTGYISINKTPLTGEQS